MNLKLSLPTNIKPYIRQLSKARTAIVGVLVIGLFGYTAYIVNSVTNVASDKTSNTETKKITFDKATLKSLASRDQVPDQTALGALGKQDPFTR